MDQPSNKHRLIFALLLISVIWIYYIISILTGAWNINDSIIILILFSIVTVGSIITLVRVIDPYPRLLKILYDSCSPEAFVIETRTMLEKGKTKKNPAKRDRLLVCLGTGLYASGKFQEAFDAFVNEPLSGRENKDDFAGYCHILFLTCLRLGKLDMAKDALGKLREASCRMKFGYTSRFLNKNIKKICVCWTLPGVTMTVLKTCLWTASEAPRAIMGA